MENSNEKKAGIEQESTGKKRRGVVSRIFRVSAWVLGVFVGLLLLLFCGISWVLTPERLTPIIEKTANENMTAVLSLKKAELSVWSTFPRIKLELDSLAIVNDAFKKLPSEEYNKLPAGSDTLLYVGNFSGSLNIPALFVGKIRLSDVELGGAALNVVSYNGELSNYDIFPESETKDDDTADISIPDISVSRFKIADRFPIRYFSLSDTVDVQLSLEPSDVLTENTPGYKLVVNSSLDALLPPEISLDSISVGLGGELGWKHDEPLKMKFSDFSLNVGAITALFSGSVDFSEPSRLMDFDLKLNPFSPIDGIKMLPADMRASLPSFESDMLISATARLTEPYLLADTLLPMMAVSLDIPECSAVYDSYKINKFALSATASVNGHDLNKSEVNVSKFHAEIDGVGMDAQGSATSLMDNPYINGKVRIDALLSALPANILSAISGQVKGSVLLDAVARFHQSDLSVNGFHKIFLDGTLELNDLDVSLPDFDIELFTRNTVVDLGTNNKFVSDASRIDSLLTASVKIDTISFGAAGIAVSGKDVRGGVGCSNKGLPKDTMTIIPLGATLSAKMLAYRGEDSSMVRLRDTYAFATLRRFNNDQHVPLFSFQAGMKRAFYADKLNRLMLNNGSLDLTAHLRPMGKLEKRMKQRYDSIAQVHPDLSQDSLFALYKKSFNRRRMSASEGEIMDFGLDNTTKRMFLKWDVSGNIKAEHGGLFSPYFPLRNRLSNFNMAFSSDSVVFKNVLYKVGHSDFLINGAIKNLRRALAMNFPLKAELRLVSDSINVNELVEASYKGSAFAESVMDGSVKMAQIENTDELDRLVERAADTDETAALLVPINVDARFVMDARNIVYSDMLMHNFNGELLMGNGAINLRNLSAESKIGSAKMTALYSAPDKRNIRFGFGLLLDRIDVKQFINMMPAVDSLMPLLSSFQGKINADIAATTDVDSTMNLVIPTLEAAVKLSGDSLVLLDAETFRTVSKWLLFKNKEQNVIPHMEAEMLIEDSKLEIFPFVFDFDRYRLAVMGSNDLALNFKYHVSVLKSPIPFKFGINLSGNTDKMKIRLGGAKYKPGKSVETIAIVDTARVNLLKEIDHVFRSGAKNARLGSLKIKNQSGGSIDFDAPNDTISREDSILFIKEGLIEVPDSLRQELLK